MATASTEPRITLHQHDRRVQVTISDTLLADTTRAIELREHGYPPRQYIPREDVRMDLLTPSETATHCPFKGDATYFSFAIRLIWRGAMSIRWRAWSRLWRGWHLMVRRLR